MKTRIASIAFLFVLLTKTLVTAQTTAPGTATAGYKLTVVVPNVSKRSGELRVGIANNDASFKGESFKTRVVKVPATGDVTVTFDSLTAGRYAVRVFQDLNGNQKIDFNGQIPSEPFGFSNVTMLMGPPTFDQCAFDLNENKPIQVGLIEM